MSHMIKGKTTLSVEDKEIVKESLEQCWGEEYEIQENVTIRGQMCDYGVIRKPRPVKGHTKTGRYVEGVYGQQVMGLQKNSEGTYDIVSYNAAYGSSGDQAIIDDTMDKVNTVFAAKKAQKELAKHGIDVEISGDAVDSEIEIDGNVEKTKMVKVTIAGGVKSSGGSGRNLSGDSGNLGGGMN